MGLKIFCQELLAFGGIWCIIKVCCFGGFELSRICDYCGKKPMFGHNVSHAHNLTCRRFNPNLRTVRARVNGQVKRVSICTRCLKAGKVEKVH
jgi:large subunit ribosomal protein L28